MISSICSLDKCSAFWRRSNDITSVLKEVLLSALGFDTGDGDGDGIGEGDGEVVVFTAIGAVDGVRVGIIVGTSVVSMSDGFKVGFVVNTGFVVGS